MRPNRGVFQLRAMNRSKDLLLPGVFSSLLTVKWTFSFSWNKLGVVSDRVSCIPPYHEFIPLHSNVFCAYSSSGQLKDATKIGTDELAKPFLLIFW